MFVVIYDNVRTNTYDVLNTDIGIIQTMKKSELTESLIDRLNILVPKDLRKLSSNHAYRWVFEDNESIFCKTLSEWSENGKLQFNISKLVDENCSKVYQTISCELGDCFIVKYKGNIIISDFNSLFYGVETFFKPISSSRLRKQLMNRNYDPVFNVIKLTDCDIFTCKEFGGNYKLTKNVTIDTLIIEQGDFAIEGLSNYNITFSKLIFRSTNFILLEQLSRLLITYNSVVDIGINSEMYSFLYNYIGLHKLLNINNLKILNCEYIDDVARYIIRKENYRLKCNNELHCLMSRSEVRHFLTKLKDNNLLSKSFCDEYKLDYDYFGDYIEVYKLFGKYDITFSINTLDLYVDKNHICDFIDYMKSSALDYISNSQKYLIKMLDLYCKNDYNIILSVYYNSNNDLDVSLSIDNVSFDFIECKILPIRINYNFMGKICQLFNIYDFLYENKDFINDCKIGVTVYDFCITLRVDSYMYKDVCEVFSQYSFVRVLSLTKG